MSTMPASTTITASAVTAMSISLLQQHLLPLTPRFRSYAKTRAGLAAFLREIAEIHVQSSTTSRWTLSIADIITLQLEPLAVVRALLQPFYHSAWDEEMQRVVTTALDDGMLPDQGSLQAFAAALASSSGSSTHPHEKVIAAAPAIIAPTAIPQPPALIRQNGNHRTPPPQPSSLTLEQVPEDWRDLVEGLIAEGRLVLANYTSLDALERYVDKALELPAAGEDAPAARGQIAAKPPPTPIRTPVPAKPAARLFLPQEEREAIADALRLRASDFRTKEEALALYLKRERGR